MNLSKCILFGPGAAIEEHAFNMNFRIKCINTAERNNERNSKRRLFLDVWRVHLMDYTYDTQPEHTRRGQIYLFHVGY